MKIINGYLQIIRWVLGESIEVIALRGVHLSFLKDQISLKTIYVIEPIYASTFKQKIYMYLITKCRWKAKSSENKLIGVISINYFFSIGGYY